MKERMKKCVKCGKKKLLEEFGKHSDSSDGRQSYCRECKNRLGDKRRSDNVAARLKHHTATRVKDQLGSLCPPNLTSRLEFLIGYRFERLAKILRAELKEREPDKKLRDALDEGYHVDHIHPLSRYQVIRVDENGKKYVDWDEFRRCWDPSNLRAIPAAENLAKGAKVS